MSPHDTDRHRHTQPVTAADRLAQIEARVEAATEGPWDAVQGATPGMVWVELRHRATICDFPYEQGSQEDAEFIAHARQDIPALLAAVREALGLHRPVPHCPSDTHARSESTCPCGVQICGQCYHHWPCPTVRTIEDALGGAE